MKNAGTLFIVATPIGNMQDITLRAVETLKTVALILAEDTRRTGQLLQHFRIQKPMVSFHEHNENQRQDEVIEKLQQGLSIALVSDAGTPLVSDPGYKLVRSCIENGIKVEAIPGSTAAIAALTVSGLPPDKFLFLGFLPEKQGKRQRILKHLQLLFERSEAESRTSDEVSGNVSSRLGLPRLPTQSSLKSDHLQASSSVRSPLARRINEQTEDRLKATIIIYESPYHLKKTLAELESIFGNIPIVICRELTKLHEEIYRGSIEEALNHFQNPKGEFVILF